MIQVREHSLESFVRDSLRMEQWWLRYFAVLHATIVLGVFVWFAALVPGKVPAGLRWTTLIAWPISLLACGYTGLQHARISARVRQQQVAVQPARVPE